MDIDLAWDFNDPAGSEAKFRAISAEALTQVARCLGLQRRFEEGHAVLDALEAPNDRVRVRYLLERGRLFNSAKDPAHARPLFVEAYHLAKSCGEEALEVDAAHMVAIVAGGDESREWNERALEKAAQSSDPKARKWRASLLNNLGWTYHDSGNFEKSLTMFTEARLCREENGQQGEEQIARWCIARCLRSLGRFDEALAMQEALLKERGEDPAGYGEEEIAENLLALGRPQEARPHIQRAYEKLSKDPWFVENEKTRLERLQILGAT